MKICSFQNHKFIIEVEQKDTRYCVLKFVKLNEFSGIIKNNELFYTPNLDTAMEVFYEMVFEENNN